MAKYFQIILKTVQSLLSLGNCSLSLQLACPSAFTKSLHGTLFLILCTWKMSIFFPIWPYLWHGPISYSHLKSMFFLILYFHNTYTYFFILIKIITIGGTLHLLCGVGNGKPLQYSYLENSLDREAWQTTVQGAAKSRTWLSTAQHSTYYNPVPLFNLLIYVNSSNPLVTVCMGGGILI